MTDDPDGRGIQDFPHTFALVTVGGVELRNRTFVAAHTTNFGLDHLPTAQHLAYHQARVRGGAGR